MRMRVDMTDITVVTSARRSPLQWQSLHQLHRLGKASFCLLKEEQGAQRILAATSNLNDSFAAETPCSISILNKQLDPLLSPRLGARCV